VHLPVNSANTTGLPPVGIDRKSGEEKRKKKKETGKVLGRFESLKFLVGNSKTQRAGRAHESELGKKPRQSNSSQGIDTARRAEADYTNNKSAIMEAINLGKR